MTGYPGGSYPPPPPPSYPPPPGYGPHPYGPYPGMPYGAAPAGPRNGLGITALVLGIVGLLAFWSVVGGIVLGVAAVIFGIVGYGRARRGIANNRGIAIAGIVLGGLAIVISAAFIAVWVGVFDEVGGTDYLDCVARAGSDQQAVEACINQLSNRVDGRFTSAPTP
jgi:hypothetical protein